MAKTIVLKLNDGLLEMRFEDILQPMELSGEKFTKESLAVNSLFYRHPTTGEMLEIGFDEERD